MPLSLKVLTQRGDFLKSSYLCAFKLRAQLKKVIFNVLLRDLEVPKLLLRPLRPLLRLLKLGLQRTLRYEMLALKLKGAALLVFKLGTQGSPHVRELLLKLSVSLLILLLDSWDHLGSEGLVNLINLPLTLSSLSIKYGFMFCTISLYGSLVALLDLPE